MIINKHLKHGGRANSPELIVVHAMAEYIEWEAQELHAADFLDKIGLSAHLLICPNGDIIRLRKDNESAWHAKNFNRNSLGIEFLVEGVHTYETFIKAIKEPYLTDAQFAPGVWCVQKWMSDYSIPVYSVKTHSELSPRRKYDPGKGFPLTKFIEELNNYHGICS